MTSQEITDLLRTNKVRITLIRKDSSVRHINGTLMSSIITGFCACEDNGVMCVWDLDQNKWVRMTVANITTTEIIP